jgi:integrase
MAGGGVGSEALHDEGLWFLLREPGLPYKRGNKVSAGRIMRAFGDRSAAEVTTSEVSRFLRSLDREGLSARNINKHREVLSAIFSYGCRADSLALAGNPVDATDKRRQAPPAALDYFEVEEVEALAAACELGQHRITPTVTDAFELCARKIEDQQDAEAFRLLFYTGLRLGEMLSVRWGDVDFEGRLLLIQRSVSAGEERLPKGGRARFLPLSTPALEALDRLHRRGDFAAADDYVLVSRFGRRLDPSALRRRYKRGCAAAACGLFGFTGFGTPPAALWRGRPTLYSYVISWDTQSFPPPIVT